MFSVQLVGAEPVWVKLGTEWFRVLGQTCCEHDHLVVSAHSLQECRDQWPHQHVYLADLPFDLDWKNDVGVLDRLELRMHKCLVKIEYQSLSSDIGFSLWPNKEISLALHYFLPVFLDCSSLLLDLSDSTLRYLADNRAELRIVNIAAWLPCTLLNFLVWATSFFIPSRLVFFVLLFFLLVLDEVWILSIFLLLHSLLHGNLLLHHHLLL